MSQIIGAGMAQKLADDIERACAVLRNTNRGEIATLLSNRIHESLNEYTATVDKQLSLLQDVEQKQLGLIDRLNAIHTLRSEPNTIPADARIRDLSNRLIDNEKFNYQIWRACVSANNDEELFYLQNFPHLLPTARIARDYRVLLFHHFTLLRILKDTNSKAADQMLLAFNSARFPIRPGDQEQLQAKLGLSSQAQT